LDNAIEIFRTGKFTPMQGGELSFSAADLAATASGFDPAVAGAPLVVGHPKLDAPAYGWVRGLAVKGDRLVMMPDQVDPAFAAMVNEGRFAKPSASFFRPDAKDNPKPGTWYLRHVGFLGAAAPAVQGLKPAHFAGADADIVTFEFARPSFVGRVRARLAAKFGGNADQADDASVDAAVDGALSEITAAFAAPPKETDMADAAELARREAKLTEDTAALEARRVEFAAQTATQRAAADDVAIEVLIKAGKILPAEKSSLVAFMAALGTDQSVSFAAPDKSQVKTSPRELFLKFAGTLPKRVDFSERAAQNGQTVDFSNAQAIADAAASYQAEQLKLGRVVDAATAVSFITRGNNR
jgi:hypothetical protein